MTRCLVVENDPTDDVRLLGEWLTGAGLSLTVVRPHAGDPLPADLAGDAAWGLQFHIECDTAMIADWAADDAELLASLGLSADDLVAQANALMDDLFEVWHPLAVRFAAVAQGSLGPASSPRHLPLLS